MEHIASVPQKQRRAFKKRQYVKYVKFLRKQLRRRNSVEVKSARREGYLEHISTFNMQKTVTMDAMQADAFWKNYAMAQEWQNRSVKHVYFVLVFFASLSIENLYNVSFKYFKYFKKLNIFIVRKIIIDKSIAKLCVIICRHSITWWRSRCIVLEQENEILRNKVRSLARSNRYSNTKKNYGKYSHEVEYEDAQEDVVLNDENLELNVTEDMLDFLEKSERHRREMQEKYKSEENVSQKKKNKKDLKKESVLVNTPENVHAKREEAQLLYGDNAPKILAMEAALQVAANRYKDLTNAQYWPNIPLKP